jgi:hypothetical protein
MSYLYSYATNSINKYESIQEDIADAYAYLDEEVSDDLESNDDLDEELTDEQVDALLAEMAEVA